MTRHGFLTRIEGLTLVVLTVAVPNVFGQARGGMGSPGMGFRGPGPGAGSPGIPGPAGGFGYGGGGFSPYLNVFLPYQGGYGYGGYDPTVASVPSAAYFTYGNTSYTTESPSPIPVYAPRPPYASLPPPMPLTALLQVQVPLDAEVWLDGQKMRSTGAMRYYRSPPLDPTKGYAYEVRARWKNEDKPIEDVRHVAIRAGATVLVDFTPLVPRLSVPSAPRSAPSSEKGADTKDQGLEKQAPSR